MNDLRRWIKLCETEQMDILYHGTSVINAASIAVSGQIIPDASFGEKLGISFTRSEKLGWDFANIAENREYQFDNDVKPDGKPSMKGALLFFDGRKMRTALGKQLASYVWNPSDGIDDEEEERYHTKNNLVIHPFLTKIIALPSDLIWWANAILQLQNTFNPAFAKDLERLLHHPLFKEIT